jgi:DNA-binding MarR family transcriptional regulator
MAPAKQLSPAEETLWRATMRIVTVLPSHLHVDLVRGAGLTASEYTTLLHLSEAPNREARMTDLARSIGLSASRTTRLVDDLQRRGLVTKVASSSDARSTRARTTTNGMAKLRIARPIHLESVRHRVLEHIDASSVEQLADALSTVARDLESSSRPRKQWVSPGATPPTVVSMSKLI